MARLFTEQELQEMIIPASDLIREYIKTDKKEEAKALVRRMIADYHFAFDLRVEWDKCFTDYIYNELGGDALYDVWRFRGFTEKDIQPMRITEERGKECEGYIDALDYDKVDAWIKREYQDFRRSHDLRIEWETYLMGYVYTHGGPEACWATMAKVTPGYWQCMIDAAVKGTYREAIIAQIRGLETHGEPLEIMEDDEKVVIWMRPCGSGQFMIEKGVYDAPKNCVRCKACANTWNIEDFPVYCVHAPLQEMLSIKQIGWPIMVNCPLTEERNQPGYEFGKQSCGFAVYKDPNDIPEYVYNVLGFKKPKHVEKPAKW